MLGITGSKYHLVFLVVLISLLTMGCKFPENFPDWQNIQAFKPANIIFGKTTKSDIKRLLPKSSTQKVNNNISIINYIVETPTVYPKIRVGFNKDKLDWIEYTLSDNISMSNFVGIYGDPININSTYNDKFDYFDYAFFNISTDKNHEYARHLTLFGLSKTIVSLPSVPKISFIPGNLLERDFIDEFPYLKPQKTNVQADSSMYIIQETPQIASIPQQKAFLMFKNGLLSYISIVPQKLTLVNAIKLYGKDYKTQIAKKNHVFYEYKDIVLLVDKKTNTVINIGMF